MAIWEIVDRGEVPEMPFLPFLEVEQLQMGDHALAVPKQFQHVLGGKFRKLGVMRYPLRRQESQSSSTWGGILSSSGVSGALSGTSGEGQLGIAFGLEPRFHDPLRS